MPAPKAGALIHLAKPLSGGTRQINTAQAVDSPLMPIDANPKIKFKSEYSRGTTTFSSDYGMRQGLPFITITGANAGSGGRTRKPVKAKDFKSFEFATFSIPAFNNRFSFQIAYIL